MITILKERREIDHGRDGKISSSDAKIGTDQNACLVADDDDDDIIFLISVAAKRGL
jgi:hypothetical protein